MLKIFMKYCIPHFKKKKSGSGRPFLHFDYLKVSCCFHMWKQKTATSRCAGYLKWEGLVKYSVLMKYFFQLAKNRR